MTSDRSAATPVSATVNNRYQLNAWLGKTVLADEYSAHDLHLDRTIVFEALLPELTADKGFLDRFRAQAQACANLNHPAIAAVLDWGRDQAGIPNGLGGMRPGPTYYMVAEQSQGRSLSELVAANGPMPADRLIHVIIGLTAAVGFANRSGVVGCGLSPDRVRVNPNGVVKVIDLGLVRSLGDGWRPAEDQLDVAQWMAPEQFRGGVTNEQSDVYQIGLLAYFLATGRVPYAGSTVDQIASAHSEVIPTAPTKINASIPKALEAFIGRSMAKTATDRFPTVAEQRSAIIRIRERQAGADAAPGKGIRPGAAGARTQRSADSRPAASRSSTDNQDATAFIGQVTHDAPTTDNPRVRADNNVPSNLRIPKQVAAQPLDRVELGGPDSVEVDQTSVANSATAIQSQRRRRSSQDLTNQTTDQSRNQTTDNDVTGTGVLPSGPQEDFQDLERRGSSHKGLYLLTVMVLLAVLAGLVMLLAKQLGFSGTTTGTVTVPAVEQSPLSEATQKLSDLGLRVDTERVPSATEERDIVISQTPQAGVKVAEGALVSLKVSMGSTQPTAPQVVGMTVDQAKSALGSYGLQWNITEQSDDTNQPGTVISQEPRPDAPIAAGSTIHLTVSIAGSNKQIPKVDGKTVDEAGVALRKEGFLVVTMNEPSNAVEKGLVIRTEPAGGSSVAKGSSVVIVSSGGTSIQIPDVVGKDEPTARAALEALGVVVVTKTTAGGPTAVGKVVSQTPAADSALEAGATVTIRVGTEVKATTPDTSSQSQGNSVTSKASASSESPSTAPLQTVATTPPTQAPAPIPVPVSPSPGPAPIPAGASVTSVAG